MKLYAIADAHVGFGANRAALAAMPAFPEDWIIVAGDLGETSEHLHFALGEFTKRFARVFWVPGNHELWKTNHGTEGPLAGEWKYRHMVAICREHGVLTPEDPFELWPGDGGPHVIALTFTLYDYTFHPDDVATADAVAWATAANTVSTDEVLLNPTPYPSRAAWCAERVAATEPRLAEAARAGPLVLVNHFPLRREMAWLPAIPRFSIWCGTRRTEDWHARYNARVVVSGHTHLRATRWLDGVRFEDVSLGYPRQWHRERGVAGYLREILPGPAGPGPVTGGPVWHR